MTERDFELPEADILAYQLLEAVADQEGDEHAQDYLQRFLDELPTLEPGLRSHFSDLLLEELKGEIARRDPHDSFVTVKLIEDIETDWRNEC